MAMPRNRLRGFVRRPTAEQVAQLGAAEFMNLTQHEAEQYATVLDQVFADIDRLDELHVPAVPLMHTTRDPGGPPSAGDDPFNAIIRRCHVRGAGTGPLAGLEVGIKDNIAVAGVPLTNSSRTLSYTPVADAVVVDRLLTAGASVTAKTNLDDFSGSGNGESSWFGPARNPIDQTRSAGGSSGGSGSAVRSGAVDFAIGVDQAGSARVPASFNGIVSIKATHGRVPSHGITHVDHTLDNISPIAPNVELAARVLDIISGHSDLDSQWVRGAPEPTDTLAQLGNGVAGMRIGVVVEASGPERCESGVLSEFQKACDILENAGATVVPVSVPLWSDSWGIQLAWFLHAWWLAVQTDGVGYSHLGEVDVERAHAFGLARRLEADSFPPFFKLMLLAGRHLHDAYFSTYFAKGANLRRALTAEVDAALATCDLLVTPTTPMVAPLLLDRPADDIELLSRGAAMVTNTCIANLTRHPALAVPSGLDPDSGMPTSIQIMAPHWEEARALRAGAVIEAEIGAMPGKVANDQAATVS